MKNIVVSNLSLLPKSARRRNLIKSAVARTLKSENFRTQGEVAIIVLSKSRMLKLNKQFLNHSHDTDVIAFNYDEFPAGGPFGDIFISAHQARVQAGQLGHSVLAEVLTLVVHGALHLLGYDDSTPRQKAAMFKKQDALLAKLIPHTLQA